MSLTAHTTRCCFVWTVLLCLAGTAFSQPLKRATRTTITATRPNPSVAGQPVRVDFRVQPSVPSGGLPPTGAVWVTGVDRCQALVEAGGCSLIIRGAGTTTLVAIYYGDRNFSPSMSLAVSDQKVIDFSISASPSSPDTSTPGQKTSYQLTLTPRGGFTGSVSLSCSDLPAGASCGFAPSSVTLNGEDNAGSAVTVQASPSTRDGGYTIALTGVSGSGDPASGGLKRSAQAFLNVNSPPTAGSRGPGRGKVREEFWEHALLVIFALAVLVGFGVTLFFAGRAVYREMTSKDGGPKTQTITALCALGIIAVGVVTFVLSIRHNLSEAQGKLVFCACFFVALGIGLFIYGFSTYRRFRLLSDRAQSAIRGLAMGFVEIFGAARPADAPPAPSPAAGTPCLWYEVAAEIRVPDPTGGHMWAEYFTNQHGGRFYLEDKTGKVLVDGRAAHFDLPVNCECEIQISSSGSPQVRKGHPNETALAPYVRGEWISQSGQKVCFLPGRFFRLTERCLLPGRPYSVAGTCAENPAPRDDRDRNMIVKGETERTFEVSWHREGELQSDLLFRAKAAIYGGAALAVVSVAVILLDIYW